MRLLGLSITALHAFQRCSRSGSFGGFDRVAFALNAPVVPRNLDVKDSLMWRPERFNNRVTRSGPAFSLELFLQHGLVISVGSRKRIGGSQLVTQCMTDETSRCFQSAVLKNRARDRLEHVRQQRILLPAATLLFSASEPQKLAEL